VVPDVVPARPWQVTLALFGLRVLSYVPLRAMRALGRVLGWVVFALPLRESRITRRNIALCFPAMSARAQQRLGRESMQHVLMSLLELPKIWCQPYSALAGLIHHVEGAALLHAALAAQRGVLIAVPHLGAWELLNLYLADQTELAVLYRAPRQAWLETLLNTARGRTRAVPVRADASAVRGLLKRLGAGGVVGILPDQQPKIGEGAFAPLFGIDALTMTLLPKLAQHTGATVLFASCIREPGGFRIHIFASEPELTDVASLNLNVQRLVQANLAQYQWSYKRYSMRPQGQPQLY
jgi:Kdo2-lipid IVA lauroyltransferase/acyltransferase